MVMEKILNNIKNLRENKGYSQEYMAQMLDLSQVAYTKLEHSKTKLTVERLYKIAEILETPIEEILEIRATQIYNQKLNDYSIGHQEVENLYQENKEQNKKIVELYEKIIEEKDMLIERLQTKQK